MDDERACDRKCILAAISCEGDGGETSAVARSPRWVPPSMATVLVGLASYVKQAGACPNGVLCEFCHEEHTESKAHGPHKQQRERCLLFIEKQMQIATEKEAEVVTGKASHEHWRASVDRGTVARLGGRRARVERGMGRDSFARPATDWPCRAQVYS